MLNLFTAARDNAAAVQSAFEARAARLSAERAELLRQFASWVEATARVSVNADLFVLLEILGGRSHQNIYVWADEQALLSGRAAPDLLRGRLGVHFDRRTAFDRAFEDGRKFCYGALNAGGAGLTEYGPYCVVLRREFVDSLERIAYLSGDSLKVAFSAAGTFDHQALASLVAPHSHRHYLTADERATNLLSADRTTWPALVLCQDWYTEVVFVAEVGEDAIDCLRMLKAQRNRMWDMAFASFGKKPAEAERALVHDFIQLRRAELAGTIRLEVVE